MTGCKIQEMETGRRGNMKERRVGTFTLGIVLLVFGVLFLLRIFFNTMQYYYIFMLWPVIFILLGGEVLYYALHQKQVQYKYDFAAILIIMMLVVFASLFKTAGFYTNLLFLYRKIYFKSFLFWIFLVIY